MFFLKGTFFKIDELIELVRVSNTAIKHCDQEASSEGKGLFCLYFHISAYHQRKSGYELKQGRNPEVGT